MVYMPLVRPTLAHNIKRLEAEFTHGYRPRALVFYVSICNEHGSGQSRMRIPLIGAFIGRQSIMNLKPNWH
jgi:hypothetical protein